MRDLLKVLGFSPVAGEQSVWGKKYASHAGYEISVRLNDGDISHSIIDYGDSITVIRKTTCDFSKPENHVIFECVDRLLIKGYSPDRLILEKGWKLGHKGKGYLDIQVTDSNGDSYLMIECKTWGDEYTKEKKEMLENGGQLISYFVQEPTTKYLYLYSSRFVGKSIEYINDIIEIEKLYRTMNQEEIIKAWGGVFEVRGVFDEGIAPYGIEFIGITEKELRNLGRNDGGLIFNQFAEILRRNVISDKTNAFNKIFNLFLCKLVDEDNKKGLEEELDFQWKRGDDFISFISRLNDLYKTGVKRYLNMDVTDFSNEEIQKLIGGVSGGRANELLEIFIALRLYKNNEFAFKDVYNKETFEENAGIVKEVVALLQSYRLRYVSRQQYLGDFFEYLLNTGIKQEAGQFFTPIPLTRFICSSLPIKEIVDAKNDLRDPYILPYTIDFASGSGHFLTEIMNEINNIVERIDLDWIKGPRTARSRFESQRRDYLWAKEYIYAIEKDYRLAKISKISTFLNGDGDATIVSGDGLDDFNTSDCYIGKLKDSSADMDNQVFDILVSNPPFAVNSFKNTLKRGATSFTLWQDLSEKGSEIECFFVERAKQLVKEKGVAAIILPSTFLTKGGIYSKTRDILFKHFEIKALVVLDISI